MPFSCSDESTAEKFDWDVIKITIHFANWIRNCNWISALIDSIEIFECSEGLELERVGGIGSKENMSIRSVAWCYLFWNTRTNSDTDLQLKFVFISSYDANHAINSLCSSSCSCSYSNSFTHICGLRQRQIKFNSRRQCCATNAPDSISSKL